MGATGGFVLGALLAHSRMLQRGLLPYVVASQTVPILAIAPMVVIWLGVGARDGVGLRLGDRRVPDVLPRRDRDACAACMPPTTARSS